MDNDVLVFAQVMAVILGTVTSLVTIGLVTRAIWMRGSRNHERVVRSSGDDARLERLEAAVDAIAIEVERISEGQRFATGLLADRLPPRMDRVELPSATSPKRNNTPH